MEIAVHQRGRSHPHLSKSAVRQWRSLLDNNFNYYLSDRLAYGQDRTILVESKEFTLGGPISIIQALAESPLKLIDE